MYPGLIVFFQFKCVHYLSQKAPPRSILQFSRPLKVLLLLHANNMQTFIFLMLPCSTRMKSLLNFFPGIPSSLAACYIACVEIEGHSLRLLRLHSIFPLLLYHGVPQLLDIVLVSVEQILY